MAIVNALKTDRLWGIGLVRQKWIAVGVALLGLWSVVWSLGEDGHEDKGRVEKHPEDSDEGVEPMMEGLSASGRRNSSPLLTAVLLLQPVCV